jgi:hypothetical protein
MLVKSVVSASYSANNTRSTYRKARMSGSVLLRQGTSFSSTPCKYWQSSAIAALDDCREIVHCYYSLNAWPNVSTKYKRGIRNSISKPVDRHGTM